MPRLVAAYEQGIFPWFSQGDPPMWWSPDPRMVLIVDQFRMHRSLAQTIKRLRREQRLSVRFDAAFDAVISHCAQASRGDRAKGTWIQPSVIRAYCALNQAGHAHSVECWIDDQLVGGLYLVALGKAVFGESMFFTASNASKIALAALVAFCRASGINLIDCQQNTGHLGFMGGHEIPRQQFLLHIKASRSQPAPQWRFDDAYWQWLKAS